MTTFRMRGKTRVLDVRRHSRTIYGRKDALGQIATEEVDQGWFIHVDLSLGGLAIHYGDEKPPLEIGDELTLLLEKD